MRVLLLTQYYPPETGAPQNRLSDLVGRLAKSKHVVIVLTALPNYPTGEIFAGYRGRLLVEEEGEGDEDNIRIIRTWIYATKSRNFVGRMLNYWSFSLLSLLVAIWKVGRQDFVIVESPPLFLGFSGFLISRLKRAKLALNVSDLWPESAIALGVLRQRLLIKLSLWLEEFLYKKSHVITGQTEGIVASIRSRCGDKPIALVPNGVNVEEFTRSLQRRGARERIREEFDLNQHFVVGYTGLHGIAQGLETALRVAQLLSGFPDIVFVFIGDGPEKLKLTQLAHETQLPNVRFYPSQPASRMPGVLAALDLALVPLKRLALFKGALPSKMFEAMGAGVPVIVSIDGEARAVVEKSQAGIYVEPENAKEMAAAILRLYHDPILRKSFADNGRRYVEHHYSRGAAAAKFEQFLLAVHSSSAAQQSLESSQDLYESRKVYRA